MAACRAALAACKVAMVAGCAIGATAIAASNASGLTRVVPPKPPAPVVKGSPYDKRSNVWLISGIDKNLAVPCNCCVRCGE
jgi:hypothetical protein